MTVGLVSSGAHATMRAPPHYLEGIPLHSEVLSYIESQLIFVCLPSLILVLPSRATLSFPRQCFR